MAETEARDGGGNIFSKLYYDLEEGYYNLLDNLENHGLKVYEYFANPIERRGIPSFPVFCLLILLLLGMLCWLALSLLNGPAASGSFIVRVESQDSDISNATVQVFSGSSLLAQGTTVNGVTTFSNLPQQVLTFHTTAPGFAPADEPVDLSAQNNLVVQLECTGTCPQYSPAGSQPQQGGYTTTTTSYYYPPTTISSPQPGASTIDVTIHDATTQALVSVAATVTLIDSNQGTTLASQTAEGGSTQFLGVKQGATVYVKVQAQGYLNYTTSEPLLVSGRVENVQIPLTPLSQSAPTTFTVYDTSGNLLQSPNYALLTIYLDNGTDSGPGIYAALNVTNGPAIIPLPTGDEGTVDVYSQGYSQQSLNFMAGDNVSISLSPLPATQGPSCPATFPGYSATDTEVDAQVGSNLTVQVSLTNMTPLEVQVACGDQAQANAGCSGSACLAYCNLTNEGSYVVAATAYTGGATYPCTTAQTLRVVPTLQPYCQVSISPPVIQPGQNATAVVSYGDAGLIPSGTISINCGDGQVAAASGCPNDEGSCVAQCSGYAGPSTYALTAAVNSLSCGQVLSVVTGQPSDQCTLVANPAQATVGTPVQVSLYYSIASALANPQVSVSCGTQAQANTTSCTGTSGACQAACNFTTVGSDAIVADIGNASCQSTVQVAGNPSPTNASPPACSIYPHQQALAVGQPVNVSIPYSGFSPSPKVGDAALACDTLEPGLASMTAGITQQASLSEFDSACSYSSADAGLRQALLAANVQTSACAQQSPLLVYNSSDYQSHHACDVNSQCVSVEGPGSDSCSADSDCAATHSSCNSNNLCIVLSGPGSSTCAKDSDCANGTGGPYHSACTPSNTCQPVAGAGNSTCATNSDCSYHSECTTASSCEPVIDPGYPASPAHKICSANSDCILNFGQYCTIQTAGGAPYSVDSPVPLDLIFTGFNATQATLSDFESAANGLSCGSVDGSGSGTATFNACNSIAGGAVECTASCNYPGGLNGTKNASTIIYASGLNRYFNCSSQPFAVLPLPAPFCSVKPSQYSVSLGHSITVNTTYLGVQDVGGNPIDLGGPVSGNYNFSCGLAEGQNGQPQAIAPSTQPDCEGSTGSCTATCTYLSSQVNLNDTLSVNPMFQTTAPGIINPLACMSRPVSFGTVAATMKVAVLYLGQPVPNATVTVYENSTGTPAICMANTTGADGAAQFAVLRRRIGELQPQPRAGRAGLRGSLLPILLVSALPNPSGVHGSNSTFLLLPAAAGANPLTVPVGLQSGTVTLTLTDALTGTQTNGVNSARVQTSCATLNPSTGIWTQTYAPADSGNYQTRKNVRGERHRRVRRKRHRPRILWHHQLAGCHRKPPNGQCRPGAADVPVKRKRNLGFQPAVGQGPAEHGRLASIDPAFAGRGVCLPGGLLPHIADSQSPASIGGLHVGLQLLRQPILHLRNDAAPRRTPAGQLRPAVAGRHRSSRSSLRDPHPHNRKHLHQGAGLLVGGLAHQEHRRKPAL